MKMGEAVTMYISYRMSLGEKARTIGFIIKNFCGYIGADKDLSIISERLCFHYLNAHGVREGVATTYWFSIYAALNGFFMWAVARRYITVNPLPKDKPAKPDDFVPYIYSNVELKLIFETALTYRRRFNIEYPEVIHSLHSDISGEIMMRPYPTIEDESQSVTDTLNEIDDFDSCAVISANIKGLNSIIDKLNESKIPFIVHGGRRRLKLHIRYINNLLKVILNNDIKSIRAVAKVLDLDIRTQPLGTPKHFSEKELFIRTPLGRNLYTLSKDYNRLEWSFSTLVSALIDKLLPSVWHDDANIQEDFNKLRLLSSGYKTIKEYIDAFAINKDRFMCFYDKDFKDCISPLDGPCVALSTIHSAKGLEWKNVFIIGMNDQNFPGIKKYDNKNMSQHETYLNRKRKELFVACTRSAGMLHISYPTSVDGEEQAPSMLLAGLEQE